MKRNSTMADRVFNDINFDNYIVQYEGDIEAELSQYENFFLIIINEKYAIVSVPKDFEININEPFIKSIVYVKPAEFYTIQQISPVEASKANFLQLDLPLNLTGKGVNVAMIDTGIDYLNEELMDNDGQTRVQVIWDQTISGIKPWEESPVPFGTLFRRTEIQAAINAYREGKSPYDIVASKDELGHGTNAAGIIGATGKNPNLKGVVPECDFLVVKLIRDYSYETQFKVSIPVYNITVIMPAIEFIYRYALAHPKPTIIYFPLGTNLGNRKGTGLLEQYIQSLSINRGIALVTATGNQRANGEHTSGFIAEAGMTSVIEIDVSPLQNDLWVEVWVDAPNIMSLEIISPAGESSGIISALINTLMFYRFIFEKTSIKVNYYIPEEFTGDELIRIRFYNLQPGIWRLRLIGNSILDGRYNAWMNQNEVTIGETKFSPEDTYGTITNPSSSRFIITAAGYNQNNNNVVNYSGMAFVDNYVNVIDVAAGAVNALTIAPNNKVAVANGTSVAAAIVAGACTMLFEWGIVKGNDPYMYAQTLKTYLARGTTRRGGDIYPNPQWGYGMLNILLMFEKMI
jgi:subtilisin family serine protease